MIFLKEERNIPEFYMYLKNYQKEEEEVEQDTY